MEWAAHETEEVLSGVSQLGWSILRRFSQSYVPSEILASFASLSKHEFDHLRRVHFLISDEVVDFCDIRVPSFLRSLPAATQFSTEVAKGVPRARVDWLKTITARGLQGGDRTLFVTRPLQRTSDNSATRLVASLLQALVEISSAALSDPLPETIRYSVSRRLKETQKHLSILAAKGIAPSVNGLSDRFVSSLRRQRREEVVSAIAVNDLRKAILEDLSEPAFRDLLKRGLYSPENHDDLFEVWGLLQLVHIHLREGWELVGARLVGGAESPRLPRFELRKADGYVQIYYQTLPDGVSARSIYKNIFEQYDLNATSRRPDITVEYQSSSSKGRYIVEVKRTIDPGYIVDGVYKTLGYIKDFELSLGPSATKAILLVWGGIKKHGNPIGNLPLVIHNAQEFQAMELFY